MAVVIPRGFTKRMFPLARRKPATKKLAKRVRKLEVSKERKTIDSQVTNQASNTVPVFIQLTNIVQGNTDITRIGNKIMITGVQLKYTVTDTVTNPVRIMLVLDKQTNGALLAANDILEDSTTGDAIISPRNRDESLRFRVLYDKVHLISVNGQASAFVSKFIKLNVPVKFDGNAGDITDLTSNSLVIMHVATVAAASLNLFCRVFFTDG